MFHMRCVGRRLGILLVGVAVFLFLSIFTVHVACAEKTDNSPTLSGGKVTPENGAWSSTFVFKVTYTDPDNLMPADGYPRVYIDGEMQENAMVENDPADNDVTDGKLYRYEWTPAVENDNKKTPLFENLMVSDNYPDPGENVIFSGYLIDYYNFYFYVENPLGENARYPETGENEFRVAVDGRLICMYERSLEDNEVGSDNTDENGYFSISLNAPDSGSFAYITKFDGDAYHESSQSDMECLVTFDAFTISAISTFFSVVLILVLAFLLSRGISRAQYLKPVLIGFLVAIVFSLIFAAGFIGLIMAGAVAGYMYAREVRGWSKQLRVGSLVALYLLLVLCLVRAFFIKDTAAFYVSDIVGRSIGNSEFLELIVFETLFSALFYIIYIGVGAILGGLLRKLMKPAEQEPVTGPGYYRTGQGKPKGVGICIPNFNKRECQTRISAST